MNLRRPCDVLGVLVLATMVHGAEGHAGAETNPGRRRTATSWQPLVLPRAAPGGEAAPSEAQPPRGAVAPPWRVVRTGPGDLDWPFDDIFLEVDREPNAVDAAAACRRLVIVPAIEGRCVWSERQLHYLPSGPLPHATRFEVRLPGEGGAAFSFETPRPALKDDDGETADVGGFAEIRFNQPVVTSSLVPRLRLTHPADGERATAVVFEPLALKALRGWEFSPGSAPAYSLRLPGLAANGPRTGERWFLEVAPGVMGEGPLPSDRLERQELTITSQLSPELVCEPAGWRGGWAVKIRGFRPASQDWAASVTTEPPVEREPRDIAPSTPGEDLVLGLGKRGQRYTITLPAETKDLGKNLLGRTTTLTATCADPAPQLGFDSPPWALLPVTEKPVLGIGAVGVSRGEATAVPVGAAEVRAWLDRARSAIAARDAAPGKRRKRRNGEEDVPEYLLRRQPAPDDADLRVLFGARPGPEPVGAGNATSESGRTQNARTEFTARVEEAGFLHVPLALPTSARDSERTPSAEGQAFLLRARATGQDGRRRKLRAASLVQVTDLAVIAVVSKVRSAVLVTSLGSGRPVAGASLTVTTPDGTAHAMGRTDAAGVLAWATNETPGTLRSWRVDVATADGRDRVFLAEPLWHGGSLDTLPDIHERRAPREERPRPAVVGLREGEEIVGALALDRQVYRPGETVHVAGWLAIGTPYDPAGVRPLAAQTAVALTLKARRTVALTAPVRVSAEGKVTTSFVLPAHVPRGAFQVEMDSVRVSGQVLDVREAPFELALDPEEKTPTSARFRVRATTFDEQPVALAGVAARAFCTPSRDLIPPPLQRDRSGLDDGRVSPRFQVGRFWEWPQQPEKTLTLTPDREGRFVVSAPWDYPTACAIQVRAHDRAGRARETRHRFTFAGTAPVFAAAWRNEPADKEDALGLDLWWGKPNGEPLPPVMASVSFRRNPTKDIESDEPAPLPPARQVLVGQTGARVALGPLTEAQRDELIVRIETASPKRVVEKELAEARYYQRRPPDERDLVVELARPDGAETFKVGSDALLRLTVPSHAKSGFVVIGTKGGLKDIVPFNPREAAQDRRMTVPLRVNPAWFPSAKVEVLVVTTPPGEQPRMETEHETLELAPQTRALAVSVTAPASARTGEDVALDVEVKDPLGAPPRSGRLAVWLVDEALWALGHGNARLHEAFYGGLGTGELEIGEGFGVLARAFEPQGVPCFLRPSGEGGTGMGAIGLGGSADERREPRHDFTPTPFFAGDLPLDEKGHAHVVAKLPDSLTRFRVVALASSALPNGAPGFFGEGGSAITVTRPLQLRVTAPRFLRPKDRAEITVLAHASPAARGREVEVTIAPAVRSAGEITLEGRTSQKIVLDAEGHGVARFSLFARYLSVTHASMPPGKAAGAGERGETDPASSAKARSTSPLPALGGTWDIRAVLPDGEGDAVQVSVPLVVDTPARDVVARTGRLANGEEAALDVVVPPGMDAAHVGLTVFHEPDWELVAHRVAANVADYPHPCTEQLASKIVALLALLARPGDLPALEPYERARFEPKRAREQLHALLTELTTRQTPDGGFAYWPSAGPYRGGDPSREASHPFASAWATEALRRAKAAGHALDQEVLHEAERYLRDRAKNTRPPLTHATSAFVAYALAGLAERDGATLLLKDAKERASSLDLFSASMFALAEARLSPGEGAEGLAARAKRWLGAGHATPSWDVATFGSALRARIAHLWAAIETGAPASNLDSELETLQDALPAVERLSTQEGTFLLLAASALRARFGTRAAARGATLVIDDGRDHPPLRAGGSVLAEPRFEPVPSASTTASQGEPGSAVAHLRLRARGGATASRARVVVNYPAEASHPSQRGLALEVHPGQAGPARTGDLVFVDVTLHAAGPIDHVVVEVPVPAGWEALAPTLGEESGFGDEALSTTPWLGHVEARQERVLLYLDELSPGASTQRLWFHVVVPGTYVAPPAHAEAMYRPEVRAWAETPLQAVANGATEVRSGL